MKIKNYIWLLAIALIACESDDDGQPFDGTDDTKPYIVVGNQGGFFANNASITLYDIEENMATQDVYAAANEDAVLGDVLQSMYHRNDEVYVVMNNSSKVEVLDDVSFEQKRTIEGLGSPRYMHFFSDDKAYITEFTFGNATHNINIVNPSNGAYLGAITFDYFVESMIAHDDKIWVTSPQEDGKVVLINPETDELEEEIVVGPNPYDLVIDANDDIWVLCQGVWGAEAPSLYQIDGDSKTVENVFAFPSSTPYGGFMRSTSDGTELLIITDNKVYEMAIDATTLPSDALITRDEQFFGISVNQSNGDIIVTNSPAFDSAGYVYLYDADGNLKTEFDGGVAPWAAFWN